MSRYSMTLQYQFHKFWGFWVLLTLVKFLIYGKLV